MDERFWFSRFDIHLLVEESLYMPDHSSKNRKQKAENEAKQW